jgi:hypothetical protein
VFSKKIEITFLNIFKRNSNALSQPMNILLILLGSHISLLLNNRINTAITFVDQFNNTDFDWFLSGGIKNPNEDTISESEKMAQQISSLYTIYSHKLKGNTWNYIYDTKSTNTAENFIMATNFMNNINKVYDEVFVVTSSFHYNRAKKIADKTLNIEPKWILGESKLHDSDYWEKIHIRNVDADVDKALNKFLTNV